MPIDKKLQAKWDEKLAKSGFVDIENKDGTLKQEINPRTIAMALSQKESVESYFEMASELLNTHQFEEPLERAIWEDHCDGGSLRQASAKYGRSVWAIRKIILKLKSLAKL